MSPPYRRLPVYAVPCLVDQCRLLHYDCVATPFSKLEVWSGVGVLYVSIFPLSPVRDKCSKFLCFCLCFIVDLLIKQGQFQSWMIGLPHSTVPCLIPVMPSARLGSDKHAFLSHWFDSTRVWTHDVRVPRSPGMEDGRSTHSAIPFWVDLRISCYDFYLIAFVASVTSIYVGDACRDAQYKFIMRFRKRHL